MAAKRGTGSNKRAARWVAAIALAATCTVTVAGSAHAAAPAAPPGVAVAVDVVVRPGQPGHPPVAAAMGIRW